MQQGPRVPNTRGELGAQSEALALTDINTKTIHIQHVLKKNTIIQIFYVKALIGGASKRD